MPKWIPDERDPLAPQSPPPPIPLLIRDLSNKHRLIADLRSRAWNVHLEMRSQERSQLEKDTVSVPPRPSPRLLCYVGAIVTLYRSENSDGQGGRGRLPGSPVTSIY
jgi:hypothetical protein